MTVEDGTSKHVLAGITSHGVLCGYGKYTAKTMYTDVFGERVVEDRY